MPLNIEALSGWLFEDIEHTYTRRDTMLYGLGLGFGSDPLDDRELKFVYEKHLVSVPTMAVLLGNPGMWVRDPRTGVTWQKVLHGEQWLEVLQPIPTEGTIIGQTKIDQVSDKGAESGAVIYVSRDVIDKGTAKMLARVSMSIFCRADGGFGGNNNLGPEPADMPERDPDLTCKLTTLPQQALIYRLNGDYNPLHSDPSVARSAGFNRPILHGLATYGLACRALLCALCEYEPARIKSLDARFSAPVYPGDIVRFDIWRTPDGARFRAIVAERQELVLNNGAARLD